MNIDITIILNINYEIQFYFTKSCVVVVLGNVPSIVAISVMPSLKACNMMDENVFTSILKQTITTYLSAYPMGCAHPHLQDLHNLTMINLPSTEKPI